MRCGAEFSEGLRRLEAHDEGRPEICLSDLESRDLLVAAQQAFSDLAVECGVFRSDGSVVAVTHRGDEAVRITLDTDLVRAVLDRGVRWYSIIAGGQTRMKSAPLKVCRDILAVPSPRLRSLRGITQIPLVTRQGTVIDSAGFDEASGWFYAPSSDFDIPKVERSPDRYDVETARLVLLEDLLGDFDFETDADRANALALLLTPILREFFDGPSPLFAIEADRPGTGKTLLARVASLIVIGTESGVMDLPPSDDQIAKKITAVLAAGQTLSVFDNVGTLVDSSPLAALATSARWTDRKLQTSDLLSLANLGLWVLTGNHIRMTTEIVRRTVRVFLAPNGRGEEKDYAHPDLERWVLENRGSIVHSLLTLVTNWIQQGQLRGNEFFKSYVTWAHVVGGVLQANGIEGFLENRDHHQEEADDQAMSEREFFQLWHQRFEHRSCYAADLVDVAEMVELSCLGGKRSSKQKSTALALYLKRLTEHPQLIPEDWRVIRSQDRSANRTAFHLQQLRVSDESGESHRPVGSRPEPPSGLSEGAGEVPASNLGIGDETGTFGTSGTFSESRSRIERSE